MDCAAVQPLLSPFLDGELDGSDRDAVTVHLDHCTDCQQRLRELRNLGEVWSSSAPHEPSERAWQRVARSLVNLDDGCSRRFRTRRWLAASIILLLCCGGAWAVVQFGGGWIWDHVDRARNRINLVTYLDDEHGQSNGKPVQPGEICGLVPFPALLAHDLPNDYKLQKCCVFCDGVVRYKYARGDDEVILLLYRCGSTVVHGDKPLQTFGLGGKSVKVAQCKRRISGSWQVNGTAVSLIAPNQLDEFTQLVKYVDCQLGDKSSEAANSH
ncbi:MAG TPA: zf-HC2 domain-containing protein [Gemmataceae bacterium]|jgi:hypothetical protein|nr:zf-HC2 domain-containing protein [Gemmataceae bacterium]